jgi:hypothetical protein
LYDVTTPPRASCSSFTSMSFSCGFLRCAARSTRAAFRNGDCRAAAALERAD